MVRASYISGESALAFHGLIPDYVPVITSVTTQRPAQWTNEFGDFLFQHIKVELFFGYAPVDFEGKQQAFLATPEKALIDLIYLRAGADSIDFLAGLRLQHLDRVDFSRLDEYVARTGSAKLARAAKHIRTLAKDEAQDYEVLR
ncbi:MAG: hypothetical protein HC853_01445 [Anaerolineae bacterium]|nr:hypothetical protein [Anaerolineae bacterium]